MWYLLKTVIVTKLFCLYFLHSPRVSTIHLSDGPDPGTLLWLYHRCWGAMLEMDRNGVPARNIRLCVRSGWLKCELEYFGS